MYISKSRPNDVNASITIENDYKSNSLIAKLTLNTGDTMQKYCYYNGQYYINLFALKTTKIYISGLELPSDIEEKSFNRSSNAVINSSSANGISWMIKPPACFTVLFFSINTPKATELGTCSLVAK